MDTLELVRFLSDSASKSIDKAESAEELLALGSKIVCRARTNLRDSRKAA